MKGNKHQVALAYHDAVFLDSDDAHPLRILAGHLKPMIAFQRERIQDTIVFFGSARLREEGPVGRYYTEARELARLCTVWSKSLPPGAQRFIVCSSGGGGIMEAANRGASDAGGRTIGLNIGLPHEQRPNPYITRELSFEFHYFFMRKLKRPLRKKHYRKRYLVEVFFHHLKRFRAIATRYDKTARNYLSLIHLACATLWLEN